MIMRSQQEGKTTKLLPHEFIPPISYRFYDTKNDRLANVIKITYSESGLPEDVVYKYKNDKMSVESYIAIKNGILIPSTGLWTQDMKEIFAGDLVACRYMERKDQIRCVFWDNGWRVLGSTVEEFKRATHDMVYVIGSRFVEKKAYQKYLEHLNV